MSQFESSSEQIRTKWQSLQTRWEQCKNSWDDEVARRFEQEFWAEWENTLPRAIEQVRELEEVMKSLERDLRDIHQ